MVIKVIKPPTFTINQPLLWKEYLEKYGFVVLEEIISENDAEKAINMFKKSSIVYHLPLIGKTKRLGFVKMHQLFGTKGLWFLMDLDNQIQFGSFAYIL